jgi:hypothetical protein
MFYVVVLYGDIPPVEITSCLLLYNGCIKSYESDKEHSWLVLRNWPSALLEKLKKFENSIFAL